MGLALVTLAVLAVAILVPPGDRQPTRSLPEAGGLTSPPGSKGSFLERIIPPPRREVGGPAVPSSIADLARRLPLERKVAQLFLVGFSGRGPAAPVFKQLKARDYGGLVVRAANYSGAQQMASLTDFARRFIRRNKEIPLWLFTIQDGGRFSELSDLPPDQPPGDVPSARVAGALAARSALSLRQLGLNGVLGPDLDVGTPEGGAIGKQAFSDDPQQVAAYASAALRGYARARLFTAPKHFPGLGAASQSPAQGPANVGLSLDALERRDLAPFRAAAAAGAPAMLIGHGSYVTDDFVTPASLSSGVMTGLLRGKLGFKGVAVTDDLESPAVTSSTSVPDAALAAIEAGADMVYISGPAADQDAAYIAVLNAARRGELPAARVDEALLRVLRAKAALGLIG